MEMIHQFESTLWDSVEAGDDQGVIFLLRDPAGGLTPCNPSKTLLSQITTVRSNTRLTPSGFSTNAGTPAAVQAINALLAGVDPDPNALNYMLPVGVAQSIVDEIERSLTMDPGSMFDFKALRAALAHFTSANKMPGETDQVICHVRRNRDARKVRPNGRLQDAPEGSNDKAQIQAARGGRPARLLYLQNRDAALGWSGQPFYWPVFIAPTTNHSIIYSAQNNA